MPWILCGPGARPESTAELAGSTATTCSVRVARLEGLPRAGDRAAGADAADEHVDLAVQRLPDLGAGRAAVGLGVGGVGELVGQEDVGARRHRARRVDRLVHPAERLGDLHARAVEAQQPLALAAHALRQGEHEVVALRRADERERDPGVARRRLDDRRAARLDQPVGLGGLDHRDADAVLDAAAGVERLELAEQAHARRRHPRELEHRGAPDIVGNADRDSRHAPTVPARQRTARSARA